MKMKKVKQGIIISGFVVGIFMRENQYFVLLELLARALLWNNYDIKTKSCTTRKAIDTDLLSISLHLQDVFCNLSLFL